MESVDRNRNAILFGVLKILVQRFLLGWTTIISCRRVRWIALTLDSQEQMEAVINAVMGLCVSTNDLPQHIIDSVVDLSSVIVVLYQETEIGMLGRCIISH